MPKTNHRAQTNLFTFHRKWIFVSLALFEIEVVSVCAIFSPLKQTPSTERCVFVLFFLSLSVRAHICSSDAQIWQLCCSNSRGVVMDLCQRWLFDHILWVSHYFCSHLPYMEKHFVSIKNIIIIIHFYFETGLSVVSSAAHSLLLWTGSVSITLMCKWSECFEAEMILSFSLNVTSASFLPLPHTRLISSQVLQRSGFVFL